MRSSKNLGQIGTALFACLLTALLCLGAFTPAADAMKSTGSGGVFTILYTNDVHTHVNEDITYSRIAAYRDTFDNVILVDAGDNIQGTAYGAFDQGISVTDIMGAAGYDLAVPGNHEFDYGMDRALKTFQQADFPYLACNFYKVEDGKRGSNVLNSYQVFDVAGVRVAFVGISTPESVSSSTPVYFQDAQGNSLYSFDGIGADRGFALYTSVQKAIDEASKEADIIIAVGHLGIVETSAPWRSTDVIANTHGLTAFIDAHSHSTVPGEYVTDAAGHKVLLTQTGCYNHALGEMEITRHADGTFSASSQLLQAEAIKSAGQDAAVKAKEDALISQVDALMNQPIGQSSVTFVATDAQGYWVIRSQESNLADLVADSYYWFARERGNVAADIAFINGGNLRDNLPVGTWTYNSSKTVNPFGNVICAMNMRGQTILEMLEYGVSKLPKGLFGGFLHSAGLIYRLDTSIPSTVQLNEEGTWAGPPTEQYRISDVRVYDHASGTYLPLDPDRIYTVVGPDYILRDRGNGFNMTKAATLVLEGIAEDYLAFAEYIQAFRDTDGDGLGNVTTANSPLAAYPGYLLNYENPEGSGRIQSPECVLLY